MCLGVSIPGGRELPPNLPPRSPGCPWIRLDVPGYPEKQKTRCTRVFRTLPDYFGHQGESIGGPGGIRTHYRSIMSRQLIPIKLPALLQENALPRVKERRRGTLPACIEFDSTALAKVCEFALK